MSSSRLPGKVSLPVDDMGTPLLGFLIRRLKPLNLPIIVATSTSEDDNKVEDIARAYGAEVYRGPLENVLRRYIEAAKAFGIDGIIRVTADNPFTTRESVLLAADYLRKGYDYVITGWYRGFFPGTSSEGFTIGAITRAINSNIRDYHREHVTPFLKEHPELFKTAYVKVQVSRTYSITVDYPNDLEQVRQITRELKEDSTYEELVRYMDNHPIVTRKLMRKHEPFPVVYYPLKKRILVFTGGDSKIGFGHIKRQQDLRRYLLRLGIETVWTGIFNRKAIAWLNRQGIHPIPIEEALSQTYDGVIYDVTENPSSFEYINMSRIQTLKRLSPHLFYVSGGDIPQKNLFRKVFIPVPKNGDHLNPYIPISSETANCRLHQKNGIENIAVYLGGGLRLEHFPSIIHILSTTFSDRKIHILMPPVHSLKDFFLPANVNIYHGVENICQLLDTADLTIASYGNFMFESISLGIPTLLFTLKNTQVPYARTVHNCKVGWYLGHIKEIIKNKTISFDLKHIDQNKAMKLIDPWGIFRIAQEIAEEYIP